MVVLTEDELFFRQFKFHKQKLVLHRASMKQCNDLLQQENHDVTYIETGDTRDSIKGLISWLSSQGTKVIHCCDPDDYLIKRRLVQHAADCSMLLKWYQNPNFITPLEEGLAFFKGKKHFHQTDFYIYQRKKLSLLMDGSGSPIGGKWSMDAENRKKLPKGVEVPSIAFPALDGYTKEAQEYIGSRFKENPGRLTPSSGYYPWAWNHQDTEKLLNMFLQQRLPLFGDFEDALSTKEPFLFHSLLTPMMNIGLINPNAVIDHAVNWAAQHKVPVNSIEGFVRQICGWREFIRLVYAMKGTEQRTNNYWGFKRKIPPSFYNGTTGIEPVDQCIQRLLDNGYLHHIERLMVLGNFFLLCEFDPNEVYAWFMELFIDAYDWVMVPNVYGMTQFADGGMMTTKPYISGSNYIFKMSDFKKPTRDDTTPSWDEIWDGLFWHFMHKQRNFFLSNPRLGMLIRTYDKMGEEKKKQHRLNAEYLFNKIDQENEKTMEQG